MDAPILDFFNENGIIDKEIYIQNQGDDFKNIDLLKKYRINTALFLFTHNIYQEVSDKSLLEEVYKFRSGSDYNKCYIYNKKFVIAVAPLGCPAAGAMMEELGFLGIKNFFACGSAGQINQDINPSEFVLVDKAIRDEGFSYHYLPASTYVETDKNLTQSLEIYLAKNNYTYNKSNTWTTDAFFRETPSAVELRKKQGSVCVEMECAGWAAVAKYRGYKFAQLLYFSDAVKQKEWQWHEKRKNLQTLVNSLMINFCGDFVKNNEN